jgi:RNA-directed DNA polymerase
MIYAPILCKPGSTPKEAQPSAVPAVAKREGEARARWAWTEPAVWTERMLTALENGVKGGVWFSLMDKVYSPKNLHSAWKPRHSREEVRLRS